MSRGKKRVNLLRDAQRRLAGNDIDGAMLEVRRALEWILDNSGWSKTPAKDKIQRSQTERWSAIRAALTDQASGALHNDSVTKSFTYSRAEAESMIAMTASMLRVVP